MKKTTVVDERMCYSQSSISKMVEGNAWVAGVDAAVWRVTARSCGVVIPMGSSSSCNNGEVAGM